MRRPFFFGLVLATSVLAAARLGCAQTIRPVMAEFTGRASGKFELVNNGDRPLNVVLEPTGFSVDEHGQVHDAPIDPGIHLTLSTTSVRIPARQSRVIFYEATAARTPAWFAIYANFTGFAEQGTRGVTVQLELPHLVYVLSKATIDDHDLDVRLREVRREDHVAVVEIENRGTQFGRMTTLTLAGDHDHARVGGCAIFPGQTRLVEIPWPSSDVPRQVKLQMRDGTIERWLSGAQ